MIRSVAAQVWFGFSSKSSGLMWLADAEKCGMILRMSQSARQSSDMT